MTLVLLHGFMGSAAGFAPLVGRFTTSLQQNSPESRVVAIDLIGHGTLSKPNGVSSYSMESVVADAVRQIREISPDEPVDLFGYSMGGRVALSLAIAQPDLVRRLVLLGASAGIENDAERQIRYQADCDLADTLERDGIEPFLDSWLDLPMFAALPSLGREWFQEYRRQREAGDPVGFANSLRGTGTGAMPPLHDRLGELLMPSLFLAGSNDAKFSQIGEAMSKAVVDGAFVSVNGAGHAAHLEAPTLVVAAVKSFLTS